MNNKVDLNNKVEDTLNCLDGLVKAQASPYLFTSLLSGINEEKKWWAVFANILSKPAIAISLSLAIILLNMWLLFTSPSVDNSTNTDSLTDLAIDYDFDQNNLPEQSLPMP